jgi:hypothetical protein
MGRGETEGMGVEVESGRGLGREKVPDHVICGRCRAWSSGTIRHLARRVYKGLSIDLK